MSLMGSLSLWSRHGAELVLPARTIISTPIFLVVQGAEVGCFSRGNSEMPPILSGLSGHKHCNALCYDKVRVCAYCSRGVESGRYP
jgi:hypothetical protein